MLSMVKIRKMISYVLIDDFWINITIVSKFVTI